MLLKYSYELEGGSNLKAHRDKNLSEDIIHFLTALEGFRKG